MRKPYSPLALVGAAMLLTAFGGYGPTVMANTASGAPSDQTAATRKRSSTSARTSASGKQRP